MTITLNDVSKLLFIPVIKNTIFVDLAEEGRTLVFHALGVTKEKANEELGSARGLSVRMEWLWSRFEGMVSEQFGKEVIRCSARAYLLYLIRCMLFMDKTTSRVLVSYLQFLEDLDSVHTHV